MPQLDAVAFLQLIICVFLAYFIFFNLFDQNISQFLSNNIFVKTLKRLKIASILNSSASMNKQLTLNAPIEINLPEISGWIQGGRIRTSDFLLPKQIL